MILATDGIASSMSKQLAMSNNTEDDLTFLQVTGLCNTSYNFHISFYLWPYWAVLQNHKLDNLIRKHQ